MILIPCINPFINFKADFKIMTRPTLSINITKKVKDKIKDSTPLVDEKGLSKIRRVKNNNAIISLLDELYPKVFNNNFLPLTIGIHLKLKEVLKEKGFNYTQSRHALGYYVNSKKYLKSSLNLKKRFDLDGNFVEDLTDEHLQNAKDSLKKFGSNNSKKVKKLNEL